MLPAQPLGLRRAAGRLLRSSTIARTRAVVDGAIDAARLRLDQSGLRAYQPTPIAGAAAGRRSTGSRTRWAAMLPVLTELQPRTALDIGCNAGWFTMNLARLGIATTGVEADPPMYRTAILAARAARSPRPAILVLRIDPSTVRQLPGADAVLLLSIWHHFVRDFGLAAADGILADLWERTGRVLFFDTGEAECADEFGLPAMGADPRAWIADHLAAVCDGGTVEMLGEHAAFAPDGAPCRRGLFAVVRRMGDGTGVGPDGAAGRRDTAPAR